VYSTCTFCHAPLGTNEALERFPVGRKLAIDQSRGRLWAVCIACGQWNLSPIEERWEAIEEGERLYRDARRRVSTDHIGLARLRDDTELIRIGEPQRPEFAAWRYGERFAKRWRYGGSIGVAVGLAVTTVGKMGAVIVNTVGSGPAIGIASVVLATRVVQRRATAVRLELPEHGNVRLTYAHLYHAKVLRRREATGGWALRVPFEPQGVPARIARFNDPFITLEGDVARAAAARMWPRLNRSGGRKQDVREALRLLEAHRDADSLLRLTASHGRQVEEGDRFALVDPPERDDRERVRMAPGEITTIAAPLRLAVEMALHEEDERQLMRGELADIERRWKEAEEIAAIADRLVESPAVARALERLRLR
jgi:hypothetical protein